MRSVLLVGGRGHGDHAGAWASRPPAGTVGVLLRVTLARTAGLTDLEARHSYGAYLDEALLTRVRGWAEVAAASARLEAGASLRDDRNKESFTGVAMGVDPSAEAEMHPKDMEAEGRWLSGPGL